ncbi:MAG: hypothetical protein K2Q12_10565, partial [Rickettsiales bacterium]|nr:hypothetical protein [Rickettsiales bacterium]
PMQAAEGLISLPLEKLRELLSFIIPNDNDYVPIPSPKNTNLSSLELWRHAYSNVSRICEQIYSTEWFIKNHPEVSLPDFISTVTSEDAINAVENHIEANSDYFNDSDSYFTFDIYKASASMFQDWVNYYPQLLKAKTNEELVRELRGLVAYQFEGLPQLDLSKFPAGDQIAQDPLITNEGMREVFNEEMAKLPEALRETLRQMNFQTFSPQPDLKNLFRNFDFHPEELADQLRSTGADHLPYELLYPIRPAHPHSDRRYSPTENCTDLHQCGRIHSPVAMQLAPKP